MCNVRQPTSNHEKYITLSSFASCRRFGAVSPNRARKRRLKHVRERTRLLCLWRWCSALCGRLCVSQWGGAQCPSMYLCKCLPATTFFSRGNLVQKKYCTRFDARVCEYARRVWCTFLYSWSAPAQTKYTNTIECEECAPRHAAHRDAMGWSPVACPELLILSNTLEWEDTRGACGGWRGIHASTGYIVASPFAFCLTLFQMRARLPPYLPIP